MSGSPFSKEKFNAREELSSSDMVRALALMSRDIQDELSQRGASDAGTPFASLSNKLATTAHTGQFTLTFQGNRGFFYDATWPTLSADDSPYLVLRWATQDLNFATPDATNGRIDLVVAQPATVDTDLQSRNILVDPVARTVTPQNVYKTSNPQIVLTVITGTPQATPAPAAVPAHSVAVAEVYVPANAVDSTSFSVVPRLWRAATFPASASNGPLMGCRPAWDVSVDPTSGNPALSLATSTHKIAIDGEVVEFIGSNPPVFQDTGANPFGSAASSNAGRPYYIYLCGGRNLPQGGYSGGLFYPVCLVESTTQPLDDGHPAIAIATPRGSTRFGASYVGLGFVFKGTTNRHPLTMEGDLVMSTHESIEHQDGPASTITLASTPSGLPRIAGPDVIVEMSVSVVGSAATGLIFSMGPSPAQNTSSSVQSAAVNRTLFGAAGALAFRFRERMSLAGGNGIKYSVAAFGDVPNNPTVNVMGWSHGVSRLRT